MKKVLIANRGEIAVRIIRACKELGIQSVAVYSEADADALHVKLADEAYCIGPKLSKDSYLSFPALLSVAEKTGADGIHPGYGFVSENADFAEACENAGIKFIGPSSDSIKIMGIKDVARTTMEAAGVPLVPGTGIVPDIETGKEWAAQIGYPVIIKATAGGGGKGIRVARTEEDLVKGIDITQKEAAAAFGNPGVYLEKFIEYFRHCEIQVLADGYGNVVHLGERDCTVQRRMQKLVEEAPSPALSSERRAEMGAAAVKAAQACNYEGAGTIEFIYDYQEDKFYFMEMNTRIQVEHPVTEMISGVDLVQQQLKIASGEKLPFTQDDIQLNGWAIECRINAENAYKNFMPSAGTVDTYVTPGGYGVRIDSAVYAGYTIPPYYDSMVAKLIVHADTREEAIAKMNRALSEFEVSGPGINTTIPFHQALMNNDVFKSAQFNTKFLEENDVLGVAEKAK
ncbi:MAG TPA: acetyl-CoA carboxylase biotin carboxylase subunit [Lysinibacillus sp.]|jgi:acetyl-CoA carboxylase biotin carboxylase subunit|uniref:Biotin carboxylase n=1 Tax=Lysinibacillus fusiformis TaxID=28031 RepID=A0A2I0UVD6_9BACI|nr:MULTISPECIES: acetyl-CoA carboxylase biotin carboxylase subunit [Lysinibacillus]HBT73709.1 acetyl-CoA carboxylase biotin carboxylase subunit [Lysinibacillus sp.]MEE3806055.1 acetyl-CoA carboxylase biotin carboxylase subunit [Lysinibacillus fusiformis]PKU49991.1 acetyl-CoA carboxylase biotin carboxylase subunit [Lysinibacillus fusiformis]WCH46178.1 acetyl-CoA carboxylase biotin carboxylase subunit [Lysinibacillus sp. OF-1]SCZ03559.1 acetyl-CoA carboxylase, biotin carboxylase subunit [Lysinib